MNPDKKILPTQGANWLPGLPSIDEVREHAALSGLWLCRMALRSEMVDGFSWVAGDFELVWLRPSEDGETIFSMGDFNEATHEFEKYSFSDALYVEHLPISLGGTPVLRSAPMSGFRR